MHRKFTKTTFTILFIRVTRIEEKSAENISQVEIQNAESDNSIDLQEYFRLKKKVSELEIEVSDKTSELKDVRENFEVQIDELENEKDKLKGTLARQQTEFENYRKRTEREKGDTSKTVLSKLVNEILPVVDNLDSFGSC